MSDIAAVKLIVNADDFGLCEGVNRGIIAAHEQGIVTSTSLMVRQPAAPDAADLARAHPALSVGLHLDLGEWAPTTDGEWTPLYFVVDTMDADSVEREVHRQLERFRALMNRQPTHLDSHQHVHRSEPAASICRSIARELNIPLRHFHPHIRYCGAFYGQALHGAPHPQGIAAESLLKLLGDLAAEGGITEIACHPSADADFDSPYRQERVRELSALTDPRVMQTIRARQIELRSFSNVTA